MGLNKFNYQEEDGYGDEDDYGMDYYAEDSDEEEIEMAN